MPLCLIPKPRDHLVHVTPTVAKPLGAGNGQDASRGSGRQRSRLSRMWEGRRLWHGADGFSIDLSGASGHDDAHYRRVCFGVYVLHRSKRALDTWVTRSPACICCEATCLSDYKAFQGISLEGSPVEP